MSGAGRDGVALEYDAGEQAGRTGKALQRPELGDGRGQQRVVGGLVMVAWRAGRRERRDVKGS